MKKTFIKLLSLCAAMLLLPLGIIAQQQRRGPVSDFITPAYNKPLTDTHKGKPVVLVDEDFSGLTAGTEEKPDPTGIIDDKGWVNDGLMKPYDSSCTKTWGGMGLYSAGGAIAVENGFLNTPTGDYSGILKMTCRVRIPKGQDIYDLNGDEVESPQIDIILLRRSVFTDYKRVKVSLTEEWQTVTFEADNGWFSDCMIQFYSDYNFIFLVDDVKIEHTINSIEYPKALAATNVADDKFIANWQGTSTAEEYLLSVYTKHDNPAVEEECYDFETINVTEGRFIEETEPGYPEGTKTNVTEQGTYAHVYTDPEFVNSGSQSLCFDADGDYVQSKLASSPIAKATFWLCVDDSEMPSGVQSKSMIKAQVYNGQSWSDLFYISVEAARINYPGGVVVDFAEYLPHIANVRQVRLVFSKDDDDLCNVAIDDVSYVAPGLPIKDFLFEDRVVPYNEGFSYLVEVPDANAEYFYYMRARNKDFTSDVSNEIEVFDVHEPVALPATEITDSSYVANWKCGPKSDYFTISQYLVHEAIEDEPDYVVLDEDFSKVVSDGTAANPEEGMHSSELVPIDGYTHIPGWRASSYSLANGMIGGMKTDYPDMPGSVALPTLDLSNNGGVCTFTIRAYAKKGDWVIIGGNSQMTVAAMEFVEDGFKEMSFTMEGCGSEEDFQIYTQNYDAFMIDHIRITQPLNEGETTSILTRRLVTDNASDRSVAFNDISFYKQYDLCYNVLAHRLFHGDENEIWQSSPSLMMKVEHNDLGIDNGINKVSESITPVDGGIRVSLLSDTVVNVYDISGCLVKNASLKKGENILPLNKGLYIVSAGSKAVAKVLVN